LSRTLVLNLELSQGEWESHYSVVVNYSSFIQSAFNKYFWNTYYILVNAENTPMNMTDAIPAHQGKADSTQIIT